MKKDSIKNAIIIILALIIVFGALFIVSDKASKKASSSTTNTTETGSSTDDITTKAQAESDAVTDDEKKDLSEVSFSEYMDIYNGSEKKIVLIARPTCHYCQIAEPIIQNVAFKYDLTINYLNTDNLSEDDQGDLVRSNDYFKEFGTPSLLVVQNGEIVDKLEGLTVSDEYVNFFKTQGFIK